MMAKVTRMHGATQGFKMGNTPFQRSAHKIMEEAGWTFERMTTKSGNLYQGPNGERTQVVATPRNESNSLTYLRQIVGLKDKETPVPTSTETSLVAKMAAMADPLLRKQPTNQAEQALRRQALVGWVVRVLDRYGPVESNQLVEAAATLGFSTNQVSKARVEGGVKTWRAGGPTTPWMIGTPSQVPAGRAAARTHGASRGEAPLKRLPDDVVDAIHEGNNGAGPEPREEPDVGTPERVAVDRDKIAEAFDQIVENEAKSELLDAAQPPLVQEPMSGPPIAPLAKSSENRDDGVQAAAQLLLAELGLKTADPGLALEIEAIRGSLYPICDELVKVVKRLQRLEGMLS